MIPRNRVLWLTLLPMLLSAGPPAVDLIPFVGPVVVESEPIIRPEHDCYFHLNVVPEHDMPRPARPTLSGPVSYRVKPHVRVHYTTSGTDAVTMAFAESAAVFAETVWTRSVALGWATPPPDQGQGGDDLFDIYIRSRNGGVSIFDSAYTNPYPDGYSTWVEVTKDSMARPFPHYTQLHALIAHELHHSFQSRYSIFETPGHWMHENTSVWMEEVIFPFAATLYWRTRAYIPNPLLRPWYPTNYSDGTYEYPGAVWPKYLAAYYGAEAPRRIWTLCGQHAGDHPELDADSVLRLYYDSDLASALGHYALWRYFTGTRDDGLHLPDGDRCTTSVTLARHTTYPASGNQGSYYPRGAGGTDFVEFATNGSQDLTISFNGENGYNWRAYVLARRGTTTYEQRVLLDGDADGSIGIPSWMVTTAVLVPVVTHWVDGTHNTPNLSFSYSASVSDASTGLADAGLTRPVLQTLDGNPARAPVTLCYVLPRGSRGTLRVTDAAGRLVQESDLKGTGQSNAITIGHGAAAGVYFCQLVAEGEVVRRRLVLE